MLTQMKENFILGNDNRVVRISQGVLELVFGSKPFTNIADTWNCDYNFDFDYMYVFKWYLFLNFRSAWIRGFEKSLIAIWSHRLSTHLMRLSYKFTPWCIATPTRDLSILPRTKTCLGQSEWSPLKVPPARKKCFTLLWLSKPVKDQKQYLRKSHQLKDLRTGLPTGQRQQLANFLPSTLS